MLMLSLERLCRNWFGESGLRVLDWGLLRESPRPRGLGEGAVGSGEERSLGEPEGEGVGVGSWRTRMGVRGGT